MKELVLMVVKKHSMRMFGNILRKRENNIHLNLIKAIQHVIFELDDWV
jgi:hypothetical protein